MEYDEMFSVLMYYGHMSKDEIMNSSRGFLYAVYQNYVNRACENLGVPKEAQDDEDISLGEDAYPSKFKKISAEEREKYNEESTITDDEFLAQFPEFVKH